MKLPDYYNGILIEYVHIENATEVFQCYYPRGKEITFYNAANFNYLSKYAVAAWKIRPKTTK